MIFWLNISFIFFINLMFSFLLVFFFKLICYCMIVIWVLDSRLSYLYICIMKFGSYRFFDVDVFLLDIVLRFFFEMKRFL